MISVSCCVKQTFAWDALFCSFRATLYQCPETAAERQEMAAAVSNRITDLQSVLQTTLDHSISQLEEIAQEIDVWQQKVLSFISSPIFLLYIGTLLTLLFPSILPSLPGHKSEGHLPHDEHVQFGHGPALPGW